MEDQGFDFGADYRLGAPIGTGASGVVREGVRKSTGEAVAVKLLRGEYRDDPEVVPSARPSRHCAPPTWWPSPT